jgi:hypothetical protein
MCLDFIDLGAHLLPLSLFQLGQLASTINLKISANGSIRTPGKANLDTCTKDLDFIRVHRRVCH